MRTLQLGFISVAALLGSGCIVVRPVGPHPARAVVRQGCPPAHHWNGFACVHNGNGHR